MAYQHTNMCACGIGYVHQYHGSGAIHYLASSDTPTNFVEWGFGQLFFIANSMQMKWKYRVALLLDLDNSVNKPS